MKEREGKEGGKEGGGKEGGRGGRLKSPIYDSTFEINKTMQMS